MLQQGFDDSVPVQSVEVLLLLAEVPQVLHRVRLAHDADCPASLTPSPGDNDASHDNDSDNDNDNDNASDNDSDAVLTPESQVWAAAVTPSVRIHHGLMGTTPILLWKASM